MRRHLSIFLSAVICLSVFFLILNGEAMSETKSFSSIKDVPETVWKDLSQKRLFFGHQSVGSNILDGIKDIMSENPMIKLKLVETNNQADFDTPLFAHSTVGSNTKPRSKIDDFADILKNGVAKKADFAFLKLCYIDFHGKTDVNSLFNKYKKTISDLKKEFPKITVIHITTPLTSKQTGAKAWLKKAMGKTLRGYEDNITKNQFNELMLTEYKGKDPVFDLAGAESTTPNGKRSSFTMDGKSYYAMADIYTDDGSHLNKTGRKKIAEQLLVFFANILK